MTYNCKVCVYNTKDNETYIRHLQSKKHNDILIQNNIIEKAVNNKQVVCQYCLETFAHKSSMSRHRTKCRINNTTCKVEKCKSDLEQVNEKLNLAAKEIAMLKECIDEYKEMLREKNNITVNNNVSVNALTFVTRHYNQAPAITMFNKMELIKGADTKSSIGNIAVHYFKRNELVMYISRLIIFHYKKKDPQLQSIWNTDTSRLAYLVRDNCSSKAEWTVDKGGLKVEQNTVMPIINCIKVETKKILLEKYDGDDGREAADLVDKKLNATLLLYEINNGTLGRKIVQYLAPHFQLDKQSIPNIKGLKQAKQLQIEVIKDLENVDMAGLSDSDEEPIIKKQIKKTK
jgi:hypothetical protein